MTALDMESFDVTEMRSGFEVIHLHLKLKKRDFRMEHSEMHFVLLPWTKTLHKPNGW